MFAYAYTSSQSPLARGILLAGLAAIGFSAKSILVKLAYQDPVDPVTLLTLRMLFAAPFFLATLLWSRRDLATQPGVRRAMGRRDLASVLLLGLVGHFLSSLLDFMGLKYISAGLERLILFLYPTLVVLLSALFLRRPFGQREVGALLLSYAGIALVFVHDQHLGGDGLVLGTTLVFASALAYASYLVGIGALIARLGAMQVTAWAMLAASGATLVQFALTHPWSALAVPTRVYGIAATMAVFSTVMPVFMLAAGIRLIGAGHAALIGSIGPVATIALAYLLLGEPVSASQIAGAALVLGGVLVISVRKH